MNHVPRSPEFHTKACDGQCAPDFLVALNSEHRDFVALDARVVNEQWVARCWVAVLRKQYQEKAFERKRDK